MNMEMAEDRIKISTELEEPVEESAESRTESSPEMEQQAKLRAVKASILARKRRAARIRNALCRKSKILKIKLWQTAAASVKQDLPKSRTPSPQSHPSRSPSRSPSPVPNFTRFSPDITCYRRKPYMLTPVKKAAESSSSKSSKSSSSASSSEVEEDAEDGDDEEQKEGGDEEDDARDDEDTNSTKSSVLSDDSGPKISPSSLLLSSRGEAVVKLDASIVEDFIRSGKPIRAAALAALEAVHGKKYTDIDLQRLRKAYIVKPSVPKGRGRRSIYKKSTKPTRAPKLGNWCSVVNSVTYKNSYYQVGDIVYVSGENERPYFLQIQSLLMDWREGEAYGSMLWLTPKPDFKGPRFPFHPKNYDLRRDMGSLDCSLDSVTHVLHCPLDYFDGHSSFWCPVPGTVYQRLGEPLVKWVRLEENKPKQDDAPKETDDKEAAPENTEPTQENMQTDDPFVSSDSDGGEEEQESNAPINDEIGSSGAENAVPVTVES